MKKISISIILLGALGLGFYLYNARQSTPADIDYNSPEFIVKTEVLRKKMSKGDMDAAYELALLYEKEHLWRTIDILIKVQAEHEKSRMSSQKLSRVYA